MTSYEYLLHLYDEPRSLLMFNNLRVSTRGRATLVLVSAAHYAVELPHLGSPSLTKVE